tara:strand:+ start:319 stop:804 length:486 start_codon:yes stop_codon:yes gene_type:complete
MPDLDALPKVSIRKATIDDAFYLSSRLRKADLDEIEANSNREPTECLIEGLHTSQNCMVGVYNDTPFIMFGARKVTKNVGCVWALGSDDLLKAKVGFLRLSKSSLSLLHEDFPFLFNYVDARNTVHIRWIKWLGFKIINVHPKFGVAKIPFYEFVRLKSNV